MTTTKQIEANRQNALLSTEAITEFGKAVVSKNAIKHGIFTNTLVVDDNLSEYCIISVTINALIKDSVYRLSRFSDEKI